MRPPLQILRLIPCLVIVSACDASLDPLVAQSSDLCPDDATKTDAGFCGCGVSDADTNKNGVPDCLDAAIDLCPDDAAKTQSGVCGCGVSDVDSNDNGLPDCLDAALDLCPNDAAKTQAGVCGCGVSDSDHNGNGLPDCLDEAADLCPDDETKTQAGVCGCGVSDVDDNDNGIPDCFDAGVDFCPSDEDKTLPGVCGCGESDIDENTNGIPDCLEAQLDLCPDDEDKTLPGVCGCGVSDVDSDHNDVPDCIVPCADGQRDCDGDAGNGCESHLATDNLNCGACGAACDGGWHCESSVCVVNGAMLTIAQTADVTNSTEVTLQISPSENLVANPYADDGLDGYWHVDGGNGWAVTGGGLFTSNCWLGSFEYETFGQTVDLSFAASALAEAAPITVGIWAGTTWAPDHVVVAVTFVDSDGADLETRTLFDGTAPSTFTFYGATITDYPATTSKVRLTFGQNDGEWWWGYYGAHFDAATAIVGSRQMRFSNDAETWSDWEPYSQTKAWTLGGTGAQTVYMQMSDGVTTVSADDTINVVLD